MTGNICRGSQTNSLGKDGDREPAHGRLILSQASRARKSVDSSLALSRNNRYSASGYQAPGGDQDRQGLKAFAIVTLEGPS